MVGALGECRQSFQKKEKELRKDLTVEEFRKLIKESISEDISEWRETFAILSDGGLMRQIRAADKSRKERLQRNLNSTHGNEQRRDV